MTERQSLVAVEERLEIEDVPVAIEVRQEHLATTEPAASLRATIADDRREQIGLAQRAELLAEWRRFHAISAGICRIEIGLAPCRMRMSRNQGDNRPAAMAATC